MIFEVNRKNLRETRTADAPATPLRPGQVRFAVERFAFTTNNVTYAVAGDMLDYWGFFPAEDSWGRIPAMGLATITESANPDIEAGGRWFGFYPMGRELVIDAQARRAPGIRDVGAHRANHAATYTDFTNIEADASFDIDRVDEYLLLRGMFMTSFLVDDWLGEQAFADASQTLVTSASSKTSISLASCLAARSDIRAVGLTSERNRAFVDGLNLYDQVITYDEIDQLDPTVRSGVVDMAGNATVRSAIHHHFGDRLMFSTSVGATHWEAQGGAEPLPGPTPEFFFAPGQVKKRSAEWGADELQARVQGAFGALVAGSDAWLTVEHRLGAAGIETTYRDLLEGQADPAHGFVCSMHEEALA